MNNFEIILRRYVQHFNPEKYWKRREEVINPRSKVPKFIRWYWLYYIKRCDAFNKGSLGTHMGYGASFKSEPSFPHGLYGIIISHNVQIGEDCTIYRNVTIGEGKDGAPFIGNNVTIGANSCIVGDIWIGDNVNIGAGTCVYKMYPTIRLLLLMK